MEPDARQPDLEPDERIASLVNEYFDRRQAGEELTPQQFASEHPELAGELQPYLEGLSLLDQIRSSAPDMQAAMEAVPAPGQLPAVQGYELHEEEGRGGMGVVYKALQVSTKRIVALKVLLAGPFASVAAQRRFEREVELAARLRHPSIVTVLESGRVSTGQQYFAMDYVDGVHLDTYVSRVQPDVRATLGLFVQVCGAVEYAHRHGVVHRDLKPANLLIDEQAQPHILDFGLAKAMDRGEAEDSATGPASASGQVMGTLKYLSPEQAAGAPAEVDVRTDVYALGIMLYQALTGALPYDTTGRPSEVIRRIQESLPKTPSLASSRVDGELDTILLKALEKDKGRRYQSVGDMGEDLRRYLAGEAIQAKRSSRWYVWRKKVSQYRSRAVVAVAALALGLLGVWTGALWSHHAIEQRRVRELFEARRNVLRIQRGLEAGELEAVLADAYTAVGRYPQVVEARLVAAQARFEADRVRPEPEEEDENLGMMPGPIWLLKNELQRDPSLWPCRLLLAQIYRYRADEERGDLTRADELEAQGKREAPDTAEAWYLKSFTKLNLREPLRYVRRALARDPTHALGWERLTYLADQIGELETALEGAERLIRLDRDNPEWPVFRNYILAKMREMELEPEEPGQPQAPEPQDAPSQDGSAGLTPDDMHLPEPFPQQTPPEASPAEDPTPPTTGAATDGV